MKKDKKFLKELEENLVGLNQKTKDEILKKYEDRIIFEKSNKRKITDILKDIGDAKSVADFELNLIKNKSSLSKFKYNFNKVKENVKNKSKKLGETLKKDINKKNSNKNDSTKKNNIDNDKIKAKLEKKKIKNEKKELKKQLNKEKKELKSEIKKSNKIKEKDKKSKKEKNDKKEKNKKSKINFASIKAFLTKDIKLKKKDSVVENVNNKIKDNVEVIKNKIDEKIDEKKLEKEREDRLEELSEFKKEIKETFDNEISDVSEIVPETKIFESKKDRRKRIIIRFIGVVLTIILLFIWLWIAVVFIASLFAYLDGVKFIGINVALFGLTLLVLWIIIIINRAIFGKKNYLFLNLFVIIVSIICISSGIVLGVRQISKIETVKDVTDKYTMSSKFKTYSLPSDNSKFNIVFNSNYKTQYTINHDKNLKDKVKVEVKYYECYYDYYVKETTNGLYVSLKLDNRDRLSVYIDDLKEGKVYDNDELSRYTVKITVNPNDEGRLNILD